MLAFKADSLERRSSLFEVSSTLFSFPLEELELDELAVKLACFFAKFVEPHLEARPEEPELFD
jgi:hypothetical protein